ncbi:unnamed protein product [Lactuca saligna]|uniref:Trichome birefringence-like N-terminal domain-containing protein n=1 Tax=Lactuca saligna TaxID=75948 RepID=A0AA35YI94_LACSI|nr:unnamed protein product [Lactuca saligna]
MKQNWWRSAYKQNHLVFKLGISILFVGFGFRLLFSQSPSVIPDVSDNNTDTPVAEKNVKPIPLDVSESPKIELNHIRPKDGSEKCDILDGEWVPYSGGAPYTNNTCRWIESHQNCMGNGRPDTGYINWRWSPKSCELPRFDAKKFLETMRDKSWAFVGDSITRNHLQSFICLLSEVEDAVELFHDKDYKNRKWQFPSYNLTVSVIWSPFLAKADIFEDIDGVSSSEIELHIDILDKTWTEQFHTWDYVLFSSGKWFIKTAIYFEENTILGCHGCEGKNFTDLGFNFAYRKIVKNLYDFIMNSNKQSTIIFRTSTPDHFENGSWSTGGTCDRRVPAKEEAQASEKGKKLKLLDVMPLSLVRPDGHPGPYRHFYPFAKDKKAKVQYDCLHWCLPGPIDQWNDLLMKLVDYKIQKWHFPSYNLTVSVIWSPFLVKAETFEDKNQSSEIQLHVDVLDKIWTQQFDTWDYVLFSSGKWFVRTAIYYENNTILGCHGCEGKNYTDLGFNIAYQKVVKNLFDFIMNSNKQSTIIFRTSTPDHFENGPWSSGGTCDRRVPAKEGEFELGIFNRILREVELPEFAKAKARASEKGKKLKLLDVMPLSLVRPDGHPGAYRYFYPFAKDKKAKVQYDCLHWCLPGPIDQWNDLLLKLVVDD